MSEGTGMTVSEGQKNELAKQESTGFIAIDGGAEIKEALAVNTVGDEGVRFSDFPQARVPNPPSKQFMVEDLGGTEMMDSIEGVLVLWKPYGVLWGTRETKKGQRPVLSTNDLKVAHVTNEDFGELSPEAMEPARNEDGTYNWPELVYNRWGTGNGGNITQAVIDKCRQDDGSYDFGKLPRGEGGKRCKERRYLGILPRESNIPIIVDVPPSSVGTLSKFLRQLGIRGIPHYQAVVKLALSTASSSGDVDYNEIKISKVDTLSKEAGHLACELFKDPISQAIDAMAEASMSAEAAEDDLE